MDFHILGSLEVVDEGRMVTVSGSKQQALLALLLLHANETLSSDRLIEELWGQRPPATAAKTLQVHVSRLRKALANGNGTSADLVTRAHGYQLRLDRERLDAHRFERLIAEGRAELAARRPERAAATLERALSLWRGPALGGLAYEPFAEREAARLGELRIGAIEELIDAKLALDRTAEVIGAIDALIAEHPYRERLRAQKMLALYRSDRQAEALQVYQDTRVRLVGDLAIEPGERLRRLEQAILAQDPALLLTRRAELPPQLDAGTPLAGREQQLEQLRDEWRRARSGAGRLILIAGEHGIGKTRLAAELAVEVHAGGGAVRYDAGEGSAARAHGVRSDDRPTLLVLDDVDSLDGLADAIRALPVLVVATAARALPGADATLELRPLDADAVRAVAREYVRDGEEIPTARLVAASGGNPQRVRQHARAWAHDAATRRLGASSMRAEAERMSLRATEADVADDVVELRALDHRAGAREVVACPFKGLASFGIDDAEIFCGRERLVAELVARLVGAPLLGIVGPSGSGKSSALRAGLLAALGGGVLPGSERWRLRLLRPGEHPPGRPGEHPPAALADSVADDRTTIVAIDQFEEIFTACRDDEERVTFVERLVARARDRRSVVIVAIRADFYGRCAAYPDLARLLAANHVLVGPMRRDELRSAIENPARQAGLAVDPELVDALVADVDGEPGALPLLSTTLLELWRHRDGRRLRLSAYEHSGGVHGAVARLAESAYERLDDEQREIARRMLLRLAGEGEGDAVVRRRVDLDELEDGGDGAAAEVLSVLTESRLVTLGEGQVEVAHEALLREWPRLRGWLEEDVQGRRLHRHLSVAAHEWDVRGRDAGELYRGARLASVLDWAAGHEGELNAAERAFVDESRAATDRSHRRLRAVLAGVGVLLVLAVVAGIVALGERGKAREEATAADAQRLGARALVEPALDRSLLLARQGVALDDTVETRGSLLAALLQSPAAIGVLRPTGQSVESVALSPDGSTLAVGDDFGNLVFYDARTRRRLHIVEQADASAGPDDSGVYALAFSPDGRTLAVAQGARFDQEATALDTRTYRVVARLDIPRDRQVDALRYLPDGQSLDAVVIDQPWAELLRLDARTGQRLGAPVRIGVGRRSPPSFTLRANVTVTADGRRVVVPGTEETIVRDAESLRIVRRLPARLGEATALALSPDDGTLAVGRDDGSLRLLDLRSGAIRTATGPRTAAIALIAFAPDGRTAVSGDIEGGVTTWDVRTAEAVETLYGHRAELSSFAFTSDGDTLYSASFDRSVFAWDLDGARRLGRPFRAGSDNFRNPRYALSSDGRLLAHGQENGAVSVVDARTLVPRTEFPVITVKDRAILGTAFVPGSHLLVVGNSNGFLALADADAGRVIRRLRGHRGWVSTPGISADGRLLVTGGGNPDLRFWSLPGGRRLGNPLPLGQPASDAQLSPDGRRVAVALGGRLEVWDARSRRLERTLDFGQVLDNAVFSPDGRLIALANADGAQVWSTADWKPITRLFGGQGGPIWSVTISHDNRTLATSARDGTVRLWDIESEKPVGALPGMPGHTVTGLFTPDDDAVIAGFDTGQAFRWDIRPASLARQACLIASRTLTRAEWDEFLPGRDYEPACTS